MTELGQSRQSSHWPSSDTELRAQTEVRQRSDRGQTEARRSKLKHKQASQHARHKPRRRASRLGRAPARKSTSTAQVKAWPPQRASKQATKHDCNRPGARGPRPATQGNTPWPRQQPAGMSLLPAAQAPTYRVAVNEEPAQLLGLVPIVGQLANSIVRQVGHLQLPAQQPSSPAAQHALMSVGEQLVRLPRFRPTASRESASRSRGARGWRRGAKAALAMAMAHARTSTSLCRLSTPVASPLYTQGSPWGCGRIPRAAP